MRIDCPNCGRRPITEFRFGGELPEVPAHVTDPARADVERVWLRTNALGETTERWFHELGCRRWLTLVRRTGGP
jgi:sarcosine oxidase, subunit delta